MLSNIDDVKKYLSDRMLALPAEYIKRFEDMGYTDFKILDSYLGYIGINFFMMDHEDPPDVREIIENLKETNKILERIIGPIRESSKQIHPEGYSLLMGDFVPETDPTKSILSLPERSLKLLKMGMVTYEAILAYAKKIAGDSGKKPIDIVRSEDGRKEISRNIYLTKEDFLDCNRIELLERAKIVSATQDVFGLKYIGSLERRQRTMEEAKRDLSGIPSKEVMGSKFEDKWESCKNRADEIYQ